ncbi:MAG: MBL fold metallo-hydrolase [Paracoccaceae bacterium]
MRPILLALWLTLVAGAATAQGITVQQVAPDTYALIGPFGQRSPENLGNNATFGLVVTSEGAVLIDAGGSYRGAEALHATIRTITDQPVVVVIDTGGQDHRWLGNSYWDAQGAQIVASAAAVEDQKARASMQQTMLSALLGEALVGTDPYYADIAFDDHHSFTLGGVTFELRHPAPAHTPGDSFVWVPDTRTVFAGDIVFIGRLLGLLDVSSSAGWIEAFDAMAALDPAHVVPGHGPATDLATARHDTRDYLQHLRDTMRAHIDGGGDIIGSVKVDQSAFSYLRDFDALAGRNAQAVFSKWNGVIRTPSSFPKYSPRSVPLSPARTPPGAHIPPLPRQPAPYLRAMTDTPQPISRPTTCAPTGPRIAPSWRPSAPSTRLWAPGSAVSASPSAFTPSSARPNPPGCRNRSPPCSSPSRFC